jgi:hypothetical protein
MATITKFEDIEAWQKARELTREIYAVSTPATSQSSFSTTGLRYEAPGAFPTA